ncbi:SymE family type I addiction module toxin [Flavobacterium sp. HJSW_4]|uniref:SymE family type I addiction module toxin n=1 Tax=Flavobacterium sp. HJSW_4 TaxID=3344660 RepID=UPI0035F27772
MKQSAKRQLKIHRKYISRSYSRYVIFPEIRLCGKWLQEIGFNCGKSVTVEQEKNKIVITLNNESE